MIPLAVALSTRNSKKLSVIYLMSMQPEKSTMV